MRASAKETVNCSCKELISCLINDCLCHNGRFKEEIYKTPIFRCYSTNLDDDFSICMPGVDKEARTWKHTNFGLHLVTKCDDSR